MPILLVTLIYVALCVVMSMKWCETMEGNVPVTKVTIINTVLC